MKGDYDPFQFLGGTEYRVCLILRDWLQHALEESLDHAIYLQRAIEELDNQPKPFKDVNGLMQAFEKEIRKQ